jgi:hypothetical protein
MTSLDRIKEMADIQLDKNKLLSLNDISNKLKYTHVVETYSEVTYYTHDSPPYTQTSTIQIEDNIDTYLNDIHPELMRIFKNVPDNVSVYLYFKKIEEKPEKFKRFKLDTTKITPQSTAYEMKIEWSNRFGDREAFEKKHSNSGKVTTEVIMTLTALTYDEVHKIRNKIKELFDITDYSDISSSGIKYKANKRQKVK